MVENMTFGQEMMALSIDSKPRHMVFSKMEKLITLMNDQKIGIPLQNKKHLLSTVHSSFSGNDLIAWLAERFCSNDKDEAIHLATCLCMYGYIYPTDIRSFTVKDDKSVRYRFQSPCYWPSKHLKLTNEKFIIYLLKRSKRNKQKHGLDEHEQTALNKLQIVFSDKMGFLRTNAEEQVKLVKSMRRDDKALHDLQERAFWRVHRPPPNQVKCLDEGPSRCFQPSQMINRKKKNRDFKVKEVEYLRRAIGRPRMKFSKSIDIFIQRNNQYLEYDPFLDPLAVQPSNPWLTEDSAFWDFNKELVEVPTMTRMKKWALSFDDLLADKTGCSEFEAFLKKEYSHENIRFYRACKDLIVAPLSKVTSMKNNIESEFLTHGALCEVNVDAKTMEMVREKLNSEKDANRLSRKRTLSGAINVLQEKRSASLKFMFQPAMEHVYALMKKDSYTRFIRSEEYKQLMQNAQSHFTKRRNLFFGSNKKKTPSPQPRRRGSGGSGDQSPSDSEVGGLAFHSYSTGNLRELDDKPKRSLRTSNSPALRRRTDTEENKRENELRRRSNLDVPRTSNYGANTAQDPNRKSEAMSQCLALSVPGKTNIVTPWEGQQASN